MLSGCFGFGTWRGCEAFGVALLEARTSEHVGSYGTSCEPDKSLQNSIKPN